MFGKIIYIGIDNRVVFGKYCVRRSMNLREKKKKDGRRGAVVLSISVFRICNG